MSTAAALEVVKCRFPEVKSFHAWVPSCSSKPLDAEQYDTEQDDDNSLVQRGRRPTVSEWLNMKSALESLVERGEAPDGWDVADLNLPVAFGDEAVRGHEGSLALGMHKMIKIKGREIVTSSEHARAKNRASYYVQVCCVVATHLHCWCVQYSRM